MRPVVTHTLETNLRKRPPIAISAQAATLPFGPEPTPAPHSHHVIVLGIDPGSRFTGFGVVRRNGSKLTVLGEGRLTVPTGAEPPARLSALATEIEALLDRYEPDAVVLESLFHGVNSRSLIVLAQARGAILSAIGRAGLAVVEYSPAEVKSAVTGNGRADKTQVARMVRLLLGLDATALSVDATDALAAAICFAQRQRLDSLRVRPSRPLRRSAKR